MKNILLQLCLAIITGTIFLVACQKENTQSNNLSAIKVYLTDHETPLFDSVFIDIQKLEIKLEDDALSNGGWITLQIRQGVYNILRFRNGIDTLFGTGVLPGTRIRKLRLTLGTQNTVMRDNQVFPLRIDDNEREVIVDIENNNFDINNGQVTFWIDFDASRSIEIDNSGSGNNNGYKLKTHLRIFSHANSGSIEGKVFPQAANPVVTAISLADTATAIPEMDGEYKIVGLTPGLYNVVISGSNGYKDTSISNISVRSGENSHLTSVTLHQ